MPIVGLLIRGFMWAMGSFIGRLLLNLGIGFVAYKGATSLITIATNDLNSHLGSVSGAVLSILQTCNVFQAVAMLTGAYSARFAMLVGNKLTIKPPGSS